MKHNAEVKPKTAVLRVCCDARTLAAIAQFYDSQGENIRSRNHLGAMVFEDFLKLLLSNKVASSVETTDEAARILTRLGLTELVKQSMSRKAFLDQLSVESITDVSSDSDEAARLLRAAANNQETP